MKYKFLDEIQKKIYDAIEEAKRDCCDHTYVSYEFDDGSAIELSLEDSDYMNAECFPAGSLEKKSYPNVESAIYALDANWDNVEVESEPEYDEWNEHGFRDAADYYHWRYG
jgi:hypothetical protein